MPKSPINHEELARQTDPVVDYVMAMKAIICRMEMVAWSTPVNISDLRRLQNMLTGQCFDLGDYLLRRERK